MAALGFLAEMLGLILGFVAIGLHVAAIKGNSKRYFDMANKAVLAQFALVTLTVLVLLSALVSSDFSLVYVSNYTDRTLPLVYKLTALWAGQAGSLLFWAWLATIFVSFELWRIRKLDFKYQSYVFITTTVTATFFMFLCTFVTSPFTTHVFTPADGSGMNPMLQNPGMIIHPPLLYVGFVGFAIPFGHALASLFTKNLSNLWIKASRPWVLFTWVFLTAGIVLGAWWAYVELGWGGYWAWDPVENASLFPWITSTALIHAMIIYERRDKLKKWAYSMAMVTYWLTVFGTFLTRSGIMTDSVHSFGKSSLGGFFVMFMLVSIAVFLIGFIPNMKNLDDKEDFNFISREGMFFMGLLCFTALTIALVFYTMLPTLSELTTGTKFSVEINSYNLVSIPFVVVMLMLASFGPIIPYGTVAIAKLARTYAPVLIAGVVVTAITVALGFTKPASIALAFATTCSLASFVTLMIKTIKNGGVNKFLSNRRLGGVLIIHIGLAIMAYGIIFSALYHRDIEVSIAPNESVTFERYELTPGVAHSEHVKNYTSNYVPIQVKVDGEEIATLYPEIREYDTTQQHSEDDNHVYAEVAYHSMARGDLYIILNGYDMGQNQIRLTVILQPLIVWIWVGCILMCIGGLYGASQNAPIAPKPAPVEQKPQPAAQQRKGKR
ncbi:MAG: cytochrome c biogenesis protein CcsA [Deferribacteraceae bacterium]|nr:cytochrome c biogenesis protein CcsA [Deferribacteraceae bacterium]